MFSLYICITLYKCSHVLQNTFITNNIEICIYDYFKVLLFFHQHVEHSFTKLIIT